VKEWKRKSRSRRGRREKEKKTWAVPGIQMVPPRRGERQKKTRLVGLEEAFRRGKSTPSDAAGSDGRRGAMPGSESSSDGLVRPSGSSPASPPVLPADPASGEGRGQRCIILNCCICTFGDVRPVLLFGFRCYVSSSGSNGRKGSLSNSSLELPSTCCTTQASSSPALVLPGGARSPHLDLDDDRPPLAIEALDRQWRRAEIRERRPISVRAFQPFAQTIRLWLRQDPPGGGRGGSDA